MMMTLRTFFVLVLLSVSHTLHQTLSQDAINLSMAEENNGFMATRRCDVLRCLNQKGLLLKMCLGSPCSSVDSVSANDFSRCANRLCESKLGQRKQFRGCMTKECLQFLSDSSLGITQDNEEATEVESSQLPSRGDLSQDRKTCINACVDIAARLGSSVGACVSRLCSLLNSSTDITFGISKRWGSRVCMENHCGSVEADLDAYVACGMEFCG